MAFYKTHVGSSSSKNWIKKWITTNNIIPPQHIYKTHMLSTKPWVTSPLRLYKKKHLLGFVGILEPPSFVEEISRGILFRVWCSLHDVEKASVSSFCWWVDEKSWKSLPSGIRSTCIKMKGRPKPSSNLAWMVLLYLVFPLQNVHKNLDAFLSFVAKKTRFRPRVNRRFETQDRLGVLHETSICKKKAPRCCPRHVIWDQEHHHVDWCLAQNPEPLGVVWCRCDGGATTPTFTWDHRFGTLFSDDPERVYILFCLKKKTLNCVSNCGSFLSIE